MNATAERFHVEKACADPVIVGRILATVRRRVPSSDADDIVQSVFEGALAARRWPVPEEIAPWLMGIARHKVADYLRSSRVATGLDTDAIAREPEPIEARDLLARVFAAERDDPSRSETLEWLVREHEGEPLCSIASRDRVSPAAVRQRVSRLRRSLRLRWASAFALLLVSGAVLSATTESARPLLVTDFEGTAPPLPSLDGEWRVETFETASDVDRATRATFATRAASARIIVAGATLRVVGLEPEQRFDLALTREGNALVGRASAADGRPTNLRVRGLAGGRVLVDLEGTRLSRLVLVR